MANFMTRNSIAAGATVNILAGSPFEFVGRNSRVAVALTTVAAEGTAGSQTVDVSFGSELQLQGGFVPGEQVVGGGPIIPDNVIVDDVAMAGDRLVVNVTNTTAGAIVTRGLVRILPV